MASWKRAKLFWSAIREIQTAHIRSDLEPRNVSIRFDALLYQKLWSIRNTTHKNSGKQAFRCINIGTKYYMMSPTMWWRLHLLLMQSGAQGDRRMAIYADDRQLQHIIRNLQHGLVILDAVPEFAFRRLSSCVTCHFFKFAWGGIISNYF